jgi:penicillin amidase
MVVPLIYFPDVLSGDVIAIIRRMASQVKQGWLARSRNSRQVRYNLSKFLWKDRPMPREDDAPLAALRGDRPIDANIANWLASQAVLGDRTLHAAVKGKVEILRDHAGVPHIFSDHTADLYFGLGLAMAEDRLWQMDRLRRRALGRQAEILGAAYVDADIAHLTVGLDEICTREVALIDPVTKSVVDAFVAGINAGIAAMGTALPIEFRMLDYAPEPFTVRDVIATARGFWWSLNGRIDRLIAAEASRLLPDHLQAAYLTPEASENLVLADPTPRIQPAGTDDATGSNNWAISGKRAVEGYPIIAGDPHQPFWIPASWYEFALHGPDDNAAGCGHPGIPGFWYGSNGTAGWCLTNNMASTRDLYREQVNPADPGQYRDGAEWKNFATRTVAIKVRGEAARTLTIRSTSRGPVVNALVPALNPDGDPPMSLRWVGMEHLDDLRAILGLGRVKSWDQFRTVLRDWSVAVFNYIYADRNGHIGYQMSGRIPIRGRMWPGVRDANNPDDVWQGYIPFEGLPHRHDPAGGTVASANQRIVGPDFKYPIYGAYSQGHRGVRLAEVFDGAGRMDLSANIALQNDVKNSRAERCVPYILAALGTNAATRPMADILSNWDFTYRTDTAAPTVFESFMALWNHHVLAVHLPDHLLSLTQQQTGLCTSVLENAVPDFFATSLAANIVEIAGQCLAALTGRLGADPAAWQWGRVHIAHWRHPLSNPANSAAFDVGPASVDGGSHTIRNTGGELPPHTATSGAEYRIIVNFATPDHFLAVQNIGNSGIPGSPHYRDQLAPWIAGTYHTVHLTRAGVEADLATSTVILPAA